jgi:hypothetical protein
MCGVLEDVADFADNLFDKGAEFALDIVTLGNGEEAWYALSGEKYRDEKDLKKRGEKLNNISSQISAIQDRLGNKVFLEEIFKYGDQRRIRDLGTSYEQLQKEYEQLMNDYKNNTDVNFIGGITMFIPNVVSAFAYNLLDYIKTGDSASLRTAFSIGVLVAVMVVSILAMPTTGGMSAKVVGLSLSILTSVLTLDAMVNNSGLLAIAFKILDVVLNKVLQLDKVLPTEGFDSDSEYYEEMMNNTRMVIAIAAVATNLYNMYADPSSTAASRMADRNVDFNSYMQTGKYTVGSATVGSTTAGVSALLGKVDSIGSYSLGGVSLSNLYEAYSVASQANDVYGAMTLHKELQDKLEDAKKDMQEKINKANRRKMESSYADAEYIMNQVDMSYHSYVLQMSEAGMTDVYDPEGTIVLNTRYTPKKSYTFGFEDMFQYESMAGGNLYTYNTLWK